MSININRVYQAIQSLANKDQRSSLKPTEFNSFCAIVMADIVDDARINIQNVKLGLLVGRADKDRLDYSEEILNYFYVSLPFPKNGTSYDKPLDMEQMESMFYDDQEIEKLRDYRDLTLLRRLGKHLSPDNENAPPNRYYLDTETFFIVYPETFSEDVIINYYRKWKIPKWTYTVVNGTAIYNGSAGDAQNFELPERYFDDVVYRVALLAGINIRDNEMIQPLLASKQSEEQENTN